MNRFELKGKFNPNKGYSSIAAKNAFRDMRTDDITKIEIEIFGYLKFETHVVLSEDNSFIIDEDIYQDIRL